MKKIRVMSILLVLVMIMAFSGCNGGTGVSQSPAPTETPPPAETEESYQSGMLPVTSDPVTFTYWWPLGTTAIKSRGESMAVQEMEKRTNVHIEWVEPTTVDVKENLNLMFASQDLADFIWMEGMSYPNGDAAAVADGIFLTLNDYIDKYCPTYKEILTTWGEEYSKDSKLDSGEIYGFYEVTRDAEPPWGGMLVRQDKIDALGLKTPVTIADWETMLTAFRDNTDLIPLTATSNFGLSKVGFFASSAFMSAYGIANDFYQVDGTVKYGPAQPEFKEYLTLMRDWYSKGLLDKDFASRSYENNFKGYELMGSFGHAWGLTYDMLYSYGFSSDPTISLRAVQGPVLNKGDKIEFRFVESVIRERAVITSSLDHDIDVAFKWFDYQYTQDGSDLNIWGIKGVSYDIDENGQKYITGDLLTDIQNDVADATIKYSRNANINGPGLCDYKRNWAIPNTAGETSIKPAQECLTWAKAGTSNTLPKNMSFTGEESIEFSSIIGDIDTYVVEYTCNVIMGLKDIDTFEDFAVQLKSMGIDDAVAIKQASYDRYQNR